MKFIMFYLQSINSLGGPGMFFSSAAIIHRLRKYTAALPLFKKGQSMVKVFFWIQRALLLPKFPHWKHNYREVANHMNCINS